MRVRSRAFLAVAMIAAVAVSACGQFENLKARKAWKDANELYRAQNYRDAAAGYEEVLALDPNFIMNGVTPYFFLANAYDNQYKPARRGEAENDAFLAKAIENYKIAAEKDTDPTMRNRALQYLVASFGPDKLDDPSQAEPLIRRMIELNPSEVTNYFALTKLYEDAGNVDEAEAMLMKAKEMAPQNPDVYRQLAGFYQRAGDFEKQIAAVEQRAVLEPTNPEAHQLVASYYWDEAYRNTRLNETQKRSYVQKGLAAVESALKLNPAYVDATAYKGLLLRVQETLEKDPKVKQQLIKEASALQERAATLRKSQIAGR
jgi:predicted Zn-dependent protease